MKIRSRRERATGRREGGRCYAMVYDDVMQSEAYQSLPDFARSVLVAIAAQYRGSNNGDLDMPSRKAASYGIDHKALSAGVRLLEAAELIDVTRRGRIEGGRGVCSLYGLTYLPLDPSEKYDAPVLIQRPPSDAWATWVRPDNWDDVVRQTWQRAQGRKSIPHSAREEQAVPRGGNDSAISYSARGERNGRSFVPHGGDAFLDSGRGGVLDQAARMIQTHPHMSDIDIAVAFKWKVDQSTIARLRQNQFGESGSSRANGTGP